MEQRHRSIISLVFVYQSWTLPVSGAQHQADKYSAVERDYGTFREISPFQPTFLACVTKSQVCNKSEPDLKLVVTPSSF